MSSLRKFGLTIALVALPANPASAGPGEPALVVDRLADPDPGFVPPPPVKQPARAQRHRNDNPTIDQAFENLGRVAGQVAELKEQRARAEVRRLVELACKSIEDARSGGADVSAWDKDCR
jgi:hypothetical protein